jgi:hypothetical protein
MTNWNDIIAGKQENPEGLVRDYISLLSCAAEPAPIAVPSETSLQPNPTVVQSYHLVQKYTFTCKNCNKFPCSCGGPDIPPAGGVQLPVNQDTEYPLTDLIREEQRLASIA